MALTDNAALNAILDSVRRIETSVRHGYTSVTGGSFSASNSDPYNRTALPSCVRCVITNLGPNPVRIYESGKLVCAALAENETWKSPTSGAGAIKVDTASAGSNISVANYLL